MLDFKNWGRKRNDRKMCDLIVRSLKMNVV